MAQCNWCVSSTPRGVSSSKNTAKLACLQSKIIQYSLGWIPFKGGHAKYKAGQIHFAGQKFSLWDSYGLSKYELRGGSFTEDSRGRWYFNVAAQ